MAQTKQGAIITAAKKAGISVEDYIERTSNGIKKCTICRQWKDIKEFTRDRTRYDGLSKRCKCCSRALWRIRSVKSNVRIERREEDKEQARKRINADIEIGLRANPNELHCALCGHKGDDMRHEYHHPMGYAKEHHYDIIPLCSKCHHKEHRRNG